MIDEKFNRSRQTLLLLKMEFSREQWMQILLQIRILDPDTTLFLCAGCPTPAVTNMQTNAPLTCERCGILACSECEDRIFSYHFSVPAGSQAQNPICNNCYKGKSV